MSPKVFVQRCCADGRRIRHEYQLDVFSGVNLQAGHLKYKYSSHAITKQSIGALRIGVYDQRHSQGIIERIPVMWKRSPYVESKWRILAGGIEP